MNMYGNFSSGNSDDDYESGPNSHLVRNFRSLTSNPSSGNAFTSADMSFDSLGTPFHSSATQFLSSGTPFPSHGVSYPRQSSQFTQPPPPTRAKGPPYMLEEDIMLCEAWVATSVDPIHGTDQSSQCFWERILLFYSKWLKKAPVRRDVRSLQNRFAIIQKSVSQYCGCLSQVEHRHASGTNDQDMIDEADRIYEDLYRKKFSLRHCWQILRVEQKWQDKLGLEYNRKGKGKRSSDSSEGSPSDPIDLNDSPNLPRASKERPMGTQSAKKRANAPVPTPFSVTDTLKLIEEQRKVNRKDHDLEKKERFERQMRSQEQAMQVSKEAVRLSKMEWEHKIMSMDTSSMDPVKARYYRKRQQQICESLEDDEE